MRLKNISLIKSLESLANKLEASYKEEYGIATLKLNNKFGKGSVKAYNTHSGIEVQIYDIQFFEDLVFEAIDHNFAPIYYIFCLKGEIFQKFDKTEEFEKIESNYSFVNVDKEHSIGVIKFPKNQNIQASFVFITDINGNKELVNDTMRPGFKELSYELNLNKRVTNYKLLSPNASTYLTSIIENKEKGVVGRLMIESSILHLLAVQISSVYQDGGDSNHGVNLTNNDKSRIVDLAKYISSNLQSDLSIKNLSKQSGIHPKKLQSGFDQLFNTTVAHFILKSRLEFAREVIETTDLSISDIVYQSGLKSRSYFSKAFNDRYGVSPSQYRKLYSSSSRVYELSYRSTANKNLREEDIAEILKVSRKNNRSLDITGCLIYDGTYFFQILEGSRNHINNLIHKIEQDSRHHQVDVIWKGYKNERYFYEWSMAFAYEENQEKVISNIDGAKIDRLRKADLNYVSNTDTFWSKIKELLS